MEDLLGFILCILIFAFSCSLHLPAKPLFLSSLAFFAWGQLLDSVDELKTFEGVLIVGRGGKYHEFMEDGVGRVLGFALLFLWILRIHRFFRKT